MFHLRVTRDSLLPSLDPTTLDKIMGTNYDHFSLFYVYRTGILENEFKILIQLLFYLSVHISANVMSLHSRLNPSSRYPWLLTVYLQSLLQYVSILKVPSSP